MKISEAFDMYRDDYLLIGGASASTIEHHEYYRAAALNFFDDREIESLSVHDVSEWYAYLSRSRRANTVRNYICRLRVVLKYARLRGFDVIDYELIPSPKREDTVATYCTAEEVAKMVEAAPSLRSKLVISLLYASGIRLSELISLNRGQIVDRQFSVIGKGKKARVCFIDARTEHLLKEYLATRDDSDDALIVSYKNKRRLTPTNVQLIVKNAARKAGILKHVSPHSLRHSCFTNLLKNGADIRIIRDLAGHSSVSTTMIYTHVERPDLKKCYEMAHSV